MSDQRSLHTIPDQTSLPRRMILSVALQGIRIQFGRSLVTAMGVVFGTAFLMSILAANALRKGVAEEDALRLQASRMASFLEAETGPVQGLDLALWIHGTLSEAETRFLRTLADRGAARFLAVAPLPPQAAENLPLQPQPLSEYGEPPQAVLALGSQPAQPSTLPPDALRLVERSLVAASRPESLQGSGLQVAPLNPELTAEDIARMESEARKQQFRAIWIVAISLLVTVIGIANAMLMRVTERFREIGTMKCLGAIPSFVRQLFLFEAAIVGTIGSFAGAFLGVLASLALYSLTYGPSLIGQAFIRGLPEILLMMGAAFLVGIALSILAALYPTSVAVRMVPSDALRSNF